MEQLKKQIGMAVRAARKGRKLTQQALAEQADVSMETISNVERAATLPTVDVLFKIARVVPVDLVALARVVPTEDETSKERMRLEVKMHEIVQALPDAKLAVLIEIGRAVARGA